MVDWENGEPRLRPDVQPRCGTGLPMGTPGDPGLYHRGSLPGQAPATDGREGRGCFLFAETLAAIGVLPAPSGRDFWLRNRAGSEEIPARRGITRYRAGRLGGV